MNLSLKIAHATGIIVYMYKGNDVCPGIVHCLRYYATNDWGSRPCPPDPAHTSSILRHGNRDTDRDVRTRPAMMMLLLMMMVVVIMMVMMNDGDDDS